MNSSIIIAKILGPTLLLMGVTYLIDPKALLAIGKEFIESRALLMISGLLAFLPGVAIVNFHNLWGFQWPVLITLFGWIMVLAGIARIGFFEQSRALGQKMFNNVLLIRISMILMLILGVFLSFKGYF